MSLRGIWSPVSLLIVLLISASSLASLVVVAGSTTGPRLETLAYQGVTTVDKGIKGVETGEFDAFMWEVLPEDLEMAGVNLSKLRLIPAVRYVDLLDINPYSDPNDMGVCGLATRPKDGVVVFNPFALREIRFQLNNLINRRYISYELLKGGGEPAFTYLSINHPAWRYIKDFVNYLGLSEEGNEILALQKIREALQNASSCMANFGYSLSLVKDPVTGRDLWTFKRPDNTSETVKITFLIRIEDERKLIGDYIASQLEKAGFLVERKYIERAQYRPLVRAADPRNLEWHLYTHSDTMLRSLWVHEEVGYWYTATYGPLPTTGGLWEYTVDHARAIGDYIQEIIEKIATNLRRGNLNKTEDYWPLISESTKLAVYQSLRVFIIGVRNFYVVNPRVRDMAYSPIFGITIEWPWRTAYTDDSILKVALYSSTGSLFMYEWNPISGVGGVYGSYIWYYVRDYAWLRHPSTLMPIPVRASWTIMKKEVTVPTSAIIYNPDNHTWVKVPEGTNASYVMEFNFKLSKYHDGSPQTLLDILTQFAWNVEWAFKSGDNDPWYHPNVEEDYKYILDDVAGIEVINSTSIRVYGTYGRFYDLDETAVYYLDYFWPSWHPLLVLGMEYCVLYGGPVSRVSYGWLTGEGQRTLDAMNPEHVADVAEAIRIVGRGNYTPPHLGETIKLLRGLGLQIQNISEAATSLANFVIQKNHLVVSNGPFYINKYLPEQMYIELKAFRDPTYPFTPDYWLKAFEVSQLRIAGSVKLPTIIVVGYPAYVEVPLIKYMIYPEEGEKAADDVGAELVILDQAGRAIATIEGSVISVGPPTIWGFNVTSGITSRLAGLEKVTLELRFWIRPGIYDIVERGDAEIIEFESPTPPTTTPITEIVRTVTSTTTSISTVTVTTPLEVPLITPAGIAIAVATLVIGLLLGIFVIRKR